MAQNDHLALLDQGVDVWNAWRREEPREIPDLRGANLSRRRLTGINLSGALLSGAILRGAILSLGRLVDADLSRANLLGAIVSGVRASSVNLAYASLVEANFNQSDLRAANLTKALLYETNLANVDLSSARGLETCVHLRPSTIDHRTIQRSQGLPIPFLQGCGVPQFIIDNISTLKGDPMQFYSCFISYSSRDADFVTKFHGDLQNAGVRTWFAPEDLKIGDRIRVSIDQAITRHDKLLLILSETSVNSQWVEQEVERAFEKERVGERLTLFPIRIDEAVFQVSAGWANTLRNSRHIGDFRDWANPVKYDRAFQRLLRDLKAAS